MPQPDMFHNLPHPAGRALIAWVCARPHAPVPDALVLAVAAEETRAPWLAAAAARNSLTSLLWSQLTRDQRQLLPDPVRNHFDGQRLGLAMRSDGMQRQLDDVVDRLTSAGLPVILLKGCALARTVYAQPYEREMIDLDLLVRPEHLPAAQNLLLADAAGTEAVPPDHRHADWVMLPGEYAGVELHDSASHAASWPQSGAGDPFERAWPLAPGAAARQLCPADQWLHVAAHGVLERFCRWPRMAADLARLQASEQWTEGVWEQVLAGAAERHRRRMVALVAAYAGGGELPAELRGQFAEAAVAEAERRARQAWRLSDHATARLPFLVAPGWLEDGAARERLARLSRTRYASAPRLAHHYGVSGGLARLLRPAYFMGRSLQHGVEGCRWLLQSWWYR